VVPPVDGPALAQTDNTMLAQDHDITAPAAAGPTMTLDGVIAGINWTNCDRTGSCMTRVDPTPAPARVTVSGKIGTSVASDFPVQIIIPAGNSVTLANGGTVRATHLRKGDEIVVDDQAYDYGTVATSVAWRARLGVGRDF